ncbi:protein FAM161A [Anguilla anguilla]|uniref:protein FAM161A n=1 Tax=Anguilla anguilla TaxID=7936 RepID=UPI0015AD3150|nr:protein FAM161A [Anguilla anguilla]
MEDSHRANVLVTSCLKTPVDPHTKAPLAQYERERGLPYAARHPPDNRDYEHDSESDRSDGEEGGGDRGDPPLTRDPGVPSGEHIDLRQFCSSNQEYYRRLEELKRAHLRTMAELEGMYRNKLGITSTAWPPGSVTEGNHRSKLEKNAEAPVCKLRKAFSAVELTHGWGCGLSDSSEEEGVADNDAAKEKSQLTSPKERIRTMWQDFTVGELTPLERPASCSSLGSEPEGRGGGRGRGKGRGGAGKEDGPERGTWRHRVTVPRPFRMTVREAERKRLGVRSRSEVELENALLRRELAELSECQRKFRASPVPAHVYLPLYEEIAARDQERRERRQLSGQRHAGTSQEPFSFLERERRRKEEKEAQLRSLPREEEVERGFRAKPVPRRVYDSTVSERMQEDRLYRAIKMQMRAQELLHSSSLPRGMTAAAAAAARRSSRPREPAEEERTEADFRPRINGEVPDLDGSYRRFREQLRSRRDVRPTTACEPFRLRTAQTAARRHRRVPAPAVPTGPGGVARRLRLSPARPRTASSSLCSSLSGSLELLPARTTDAAKKRQEAVRRVLEQRTKAKEEEEGWRRRQRQRERRLQRVVSRRARANDPHLALSQTCRAKLRQFRKQDLQRRKEYREEMREMRERVKERPLLLEQVTQRNAKRAAERRYTDTLRGHGLSEDFVRGMAPERKPRQRPRGAPDDQSSVASEEKPRRWSFCLNRGFVTAGDSSFFPSGKGDAVAGLSAGSESPADDYPDDYEELDDRELSGEEKGQEEEEGDSNKDSEEEEEEEEDDDEADREVDENDQ